MARFHKGRDAEEGFTLVEMAVSVALTFLLGGVVVSLLMSSQNTAGTVQNGVSNLDGAQIEMQQVTRLVRAAVIPAPGTNALLSAAASSLQFYSEVGTPNPQGPVLEDLYVSGGHLYDKATFPASSPSSPLTYNTTPQVSDLGPGVQSLSFTYYGQKDNLLSLGTGGLLSTAQAAQVTYVGITLVTDAKGANATLTTKVFVRNNYYSYAATATTGVA